MTFNDFNRYQVESVARACLKAIARHTKPVKQPSQQKQGVAA